MRASGHPTAHSTIDNDQHREQPTPHVPSCEHSSAKQNEGKSGHQPDNTERAAPASPTSIMPPRIVVSIRHLRRRNQLPRHDEAHQVGYAVRDEKGRESEAHQAGWAARADASARRRAATSG